MELHHLRYFVAVAEKLSFTKAAASLHLAQPSLTRQILNLEAEIGVRLLNRSTTRVTLTEAGASFLVDARRVLALTAEGVQKVQRMNRKETSQLKIGYSAFFSFEQLPHTLHALRFADLNVTLNLSDMTPAEQFRALEAGTIDLGFVGICPPTGAADLKWESVARLEVIAGVPANHPLARKRRIRLPDLNTMFLASMSEETFPGGRAWLDRICNEAGFVPRVLHNVATESHLLSIVAEGLGVMLTIGPVKKLAHREVVFRPLAPAITTDYYIAWKESNRSKALSQYIEILKIPVVGHRERGPLAIDEPPNLHLPVNRPRPENRL